MKNYDAIIIGAGHNGLTNAAYLAKAGLDVVLLEKNDFIGGASCTQEFHEGWKYSSYSYVCSMMRQAIHRDLDLASHGLLIVPYLGTVNFGDGAFPGRPDSLRTTHPQDIDAHPARPHLVSAARHHGIAFSCEANVEPG